MFAFSLILTLLPGILIVFVLVYALKNREKGDEHVVRHLYTYLVLFATLMMVIGGGISIFMAAADLISPPAYYQTFSDYKQMREMDKEGQSNKVERTEEELRADYDQMIEDEKNRETQRAKNQLIKSLGFIAIPLPIFLYFNRMRKRQAE
ncbi:hypothetical protein LS684_08725 [Cytobacillus spongiae]|uniref:hypothetical protein n=1 Tax=Cytobacillus spongiae TaxID=2901381 RepID=UPI001F34149F|nr:hypothetical protein [Cytobacillus spongiae]UII57500.1 hypothetical protein LS684_08725 [Cytobacillus spongiae]